MLGLVTKVTDPKGTVRTFEYDYMGRQTKVTDPIGSTTTQYDDDGMMTKVIDGGGREWVYAYDLLLKRLTKVTDPNSKVTKYDYDYSGQVTKVGAGSLGNIEPTTYAYSSTTGQLTSVTYGAGGTVTYYYDTTGRLSRFDDVWSALGGGGPAKLYNYDDAGRLTAHTSYGDDLDYAFDSAGNVTDMVDYFGNATAYTYTDRSRVSTITAPGNRVWTYHYDAVGRVDDYTHGNGMWTDYQYDTDGRLTKIAHRDGAVEKQAFAYALDNAGNITRTTHVDGSYWDYEYDGRYRLTKATRKSASTNIQAKYEYVYALRDNLLTKYVPWEDNFADGVVGDDWTASSGPWGLYGTALLKSDPAQAARLDLTTDDDSTEIQFSYILNNAGSSPYYADVSVRVNATGSERLLMRLSSAAASLHYWNGSTWTQLSSQGGGASSVGTWYDARIVTDGGTVKVYRSLSTVAGGTGGPETEIFSYSSANQFDSKKIWVHSAASQNPFYTNFRVLADDLKRDVIFTNKNNNEINTMTDYNGYTTYAYDDWGRMSTETRGSQSRTFAYVMGSKLAQVSGTLGGANTVVYGYGGDGKRNFRMLNGAVTASYRWDAGYNVINEKNASGALARTYVVAPKPVGVSAGSPMDGIMVSQGPVGMTLAEVGGSNPATGSYRYYMHDQIQSTRGLFDQSKVSLGAFEFTPYGEGYTSAAPVNVTKRFTGLDLDSITGQYYAPYRHYAPNLSRWLTRDPLGIVEGPNLYAYVRSAVVRAKDTLGLMRDCDQEHNDCHESCMSKPCPWEDSDNSDQWNKNARVRYCTSICLVEYMECMASNLAEWCAEHPFLCAVVVIIIIVPKPVPIIILPV
jgi:RHS repeat-associated protein